MGQRLDSSPSLIDRDADQAGGTNGSSRPVRAVNRAFRRRWVALGALLTPPVLWLLVVYIASLVLLVAASMFELDPTSQKPTTSFTTQNIIDAFTKSEYLQATVRSVGLAAAVTLLCFLIALPVAFCIAKIVPRWARRGLVVAMLLPLWAGYLVKAYAWKAMLRPASPFGIDKNGGFLEATFGWTPGYGYVAVVLSLTYLWLPYMVLPIYMGFERLPESLLDASGDLGARPLRTFRSVIMPLMVPSIAAGSIFTFSLSLGDYIIPTVVTERKVQMIGNVIERTLLAPNQPLAAAITLWPLLIIVVYLFGMRRAGAFESI
jgi:putative spermidine/putrescine transport system permease protein